MYKELLVTPQTIHRIVTHYRPIRSYDFFGYLLPYDKRGKYLIAIWMNGQIMLFPAEPHYKLTNRKAQRIIKHLVRLNVLQYDSVVFEEFDVRKHIPFDENSILRVSEYFFFPPNSST